MDTSALVAIADRASSAHQAVMQVIDRAEELLIVPSTVLPEADYLITRIVAAHVAEAMLTSVFGGELGMEPFGLGDLGRSLEVMRIYRDQPIGLVDASIVALAERLNIVRVLTLDHRHFRVLRPRHSDAFDIVP